jgi:hypothetical protein
MIPCLRVCKEISLISAVISNLPKASTDWIKLLIGFVRVSNFFHLFQKTRQGFFINTLNNSEFFDQTSQDFFSCICSLGIGVVIKMLTRLIGVNYSFDFERQPGYITGP